MAIANKILEAITEQKAQGYYPVKIVISPFAAYKLINGEIIPTGRDCTIPMTCLSGELFGIEVETSSSQTDDFILYTRDQRACPHGN